jgi:predicted MPP superfamily phosphohydrolase
MAVKKDGRSTRLVLAGQVALNGVLLCAGVWVAWSGSRRALFVLALVPLVFVPFSYARLRLHRLLAVQLDPSSIWICAAAGLSFDSIMVAQLLTARQPSEISILRAEGVTWIGAVWFSGHALLVLGYALTGPVRFVGRRLRGWLPRIGSLPPHGDEMLIGRRELLRKAGLFGAAVPFGISLSGVPLSYDFRVELREIVLPFWPPALDGLRVVHLSDIHVGGSMDRVRLLQVAELTNACRPDLVLHTGDFLTHRSGDFDAPLYDALARIRAPHGQWASFGNHDFDDPQRLERRLRDCGVTVLRNRLAVIARDGQALEIGGTDFVFGRSQRVAAYARVVSSWGARGGAPRILLNHDPTAFAALPAGCADLVLSGHTHGGHIGVQLTSSYAVTLVGLAGFPDQGLFARGDMRLFVTRCVGFYGYPMRIGIPPEIALLILRSPQVVGRQPTHARFI